MAVPPSENLSSLMDQMFGPSKKPETGLPWKAKRIDGKLYLPIDQVVELLEQNDVLPAARRGLEKHINNEKKEQ